MFVDTVNKINISDWGRVGPTPMKIELRGQIGVRSVPEAEFVVKNVLLLHKQADKYREKIVRMRDEYVYNFGSCGINTASAIRRLLQEGGNRPGSNS